jgi:hypothetical protein
MLALVEGGLVVDVETLSFVVFSFRSWAIFSSSSLDLPNKNPTSV